METHDENAHNARHVPDPERGKGQAAIVFWSALIGILVVLVLVLMVTVGPLFWDGRW